MNDPTPFSSLTSFTIAIFSAIILQIRLEILHYKYGEGFLVQLKKWWTDSHQGEISENEEFGVNFHRIMNIGSILGFIIVIIGGMGIIHFESYPLFGYKGFVPARYLAHLSAVDVIWIIHIIQNPFYRKKLYLMLTFQTETIQIVPM